MTIHMLDRSLLSGFPLFAGMSNDELEDVLTTAGGRRFRRGEPVFEQGRIAERFFLVLHGRLRETQITPTGQEVVVRVVSPGDICGIAMMLHRPDYAATATAVADSVLLQWPMDAWVDIVDRHPTLVLNIMQSMGARLQEAHARIRELSTEAVERRVGHAVLRLINQSGRKEETGIRIDFPISRQDIAEMTGTTLNTVSRILSAWGDAGIVDGGRQKLLVKDPHRLLLIADGAVEGLLRWPAVNGDFRGSAPRSLRTAGNGPRCRPFFDAREYGRLQVVKRIAVLAGGIIQVVKTGDRATDAVQVPIQKDRNTPGQRAVISASDIFSISS